jgi:hypothetical protein
MALDVNKRINKKTKCWVKDKAKYIVYTLYKNIFSEWLRINHAKISMCTSLLIHIPSKIIRCKYLFNCSLWNEAVNYTV